jgi:PAS domain-containing protein
MQHHQQQQQQQGTCSSSSHEETTTTATLAPVMVPQHYYASAGALPLPTAAIPMTYAAPPSSVVPQPTPQAPHQELAMFHAALQGQMMGHNMTQEFPDRIASSNKRAAASDHPPYTNAPPNSKQSRTINPHGPHHANQYVAVVASTITPDPSASSLSSITATPPYLAPAKRAPTITKSTTTTTGKGAFRKLDQVTLDAMAPNERRRYDRNLREQERSNRINQQIKELSDVLSGSGVPFKANKYSILCSVVEYINQLQSRALLLDEEHGKLITTIQQTSEIVISGGSISQTDSEEFDSTQDDNTQGPHGPLSRVVGNSSSRHRGGLLSKQKRSSSSTVKLDVGNDSNFFFVNGLDYQTLFSQCSAAMGVVALDGRFLTWNAALEAILGLSKKELSQTSLFHDLLGTTEMEELFHVMGDALKCDNTIHINDDDATNTGMSSSNNEAAEDEEKKKSSSYNLQTYWSGFITRKSKGKEVSESNQIHSSIPLFGTLCVIH